MNCSRTKQHSNQHRHTRRIIVRLFYVLPSVPWCCWLGSTKDPDVTWWNGRGCPLVMHYWVDLQSVHGFHCYDSTHVCKLIALYSANAYSAEHEMSTSACTCSMPGYFHTDTTILTSLLTANNFLWCFDTVGWVTRRGSGLKKTCATFRKAFLPEQMEEENPRVHLGNGS